MNVITDNLGIGVPPPLVHLASSFRVNEFHSFTWPAFLERYEEMQRSPQRKYPRLASQIPRFSTIKNDSIRRISTFA